MAVGLIGVFVCCVPTVMLFARLPPGETFSELYVLGPGHMAEGYPFNVTGGVNYLVYVGVGNHMGSAAYYLLQVKFRNQTEPLPNSTSAVPSDLVSLYTYRVLIEDNSSSEVPLSFLLSDVSFSDNESTVGNISINGVQSTINEHSSWDTNSTGYYYQIFVELWIYEAKSDAFVFHNRFVSLWLNMTASS
jgi:uncharacterized membrane protein